MGRNAFLSVFTELRVGLSVMLAQVLLGDLGRGMMTFDRKNGAQPLIGLLLSYSETFWVLFWNGILKLLIFTYNRQTNVKQNDGSLHTLNICLNLKYAHCLLYINHLL